MEHIYHSMSRNRQLFLIEMMTGMGSLPLYLAHSLRIYQSFGWLRQPKRNHGCYTSCYGIHPGHFFLIFRAHAATQETYVKNDCFSSPCPLFDLHYSRVLLIPTGISLQLFILLYIVAFALNGLMAPALMEWLVVSTPNSIRGQYFAKRERFGFALSVVLSFSAGKLLDYYEIIDLEAQGFLFVGAIVLILGIINFVSVHRMEELTHDYVPKQI